MDAASTLKVALPMRLACLGLAMGLVCSVRLWTGIDRAFPKCPLIAIDFFAHGAHGYTLVTILEPLLSATVLLISLLLAFRPERTQNKSQGVAKIVARPFPEVLLFCSLAVLIALDLNRFQPWLYEYLIIIFMYLVPSKNSQENEQKNSSENLEETKAGAVLCLLVAIYFFSGLQKFNWRFLAFMGPWLLGFSHSPAISCQDNTLAITASAVLALTEVGLALALCFGKTRKVGIGLSVIMHAAILYSVGPHRFNINAAIWPWNITQVALLIICCMQLGKRNLFDKTLLQSAMQQPLLALVLALVCLVVPALGLLQIADPYPAFAFYTGDIPEGKLYFEKSLQSKLPSLMQRDTCFYDRTLGLWCIDLIDWSSAELGSPIYANKHCIEAAARSFAGRYPDDLVVLGSFSYPKLSKITHLRYDMVGGTRAQLEAVQAAMGQSSK